METAPENQAINKEENSLSAQSSRKSSGRGINTTRLLYSRSSQRMILKDKVCRAIQKETTIPAFLETTQKLTQVVNQADINLEKVMDIVKVDPGITAKLLKIASSPAYSSKEITSIQDALLIVGMDEIRNLATTLLVIDHFSHLRIKINWKLFWLHSVLTARLTEKFADAYRKANGKEYLAGLLHDIGKLYLEHYFPKEFELVILLSSIADQGMYEAEKQLMDITHAEVSGLLCREWHLHQEIVRSVAFHHEPECENNYDPEEPYYQTLLALCICIADKVANLCHANIQGGEKMDNVVIESLPEWKRLKKFSPNNTLILDVAGELQKAEDIISGISAV